jgi:Leucine-rich repeat (LRR) protein
MDNNNNNNDLELHPIASDQDNKTTISEFPDFAQVIQRERESKKSETSFEYKLKRIKARALTEPCIIQHTQPQLEAFFGAVYFTEKKISDFKQFVNLEWQHGELMHQAQLTPMQEEYLKLITIKSLILSENKLEKLPLELPTLVPHLTRLDLSHNQCTEIPAVIFGLTALTKLNVSHNAIEKISHEIGNLKNLKTFDVSHNKLTSLPKELLALEVDCNFEGNRIDPSILKTSSEKQPTQKLSILQKLKLKK